MTRRTWGRRERGGAWVRGGRMGSRARLGWLGVTYVVEDGGVGVHGGGHGRGAAVGILQVEEGRSAVDGLEDLGGPVGRGDHGGGLAGHLREGRRVDGERDRSAMGDGGGVSRGAVAARYPGARETAFRDGSKARGGVKMAPSRRGSGGSATRATRDGRRGIASRFNLASASSMSETGKGSRRVAPRRWPGCWRPRPDRAARSPAPRSLPRRQPGAASAR